MNQKDYKAIAEIINLSIIANSSPFAPKKIINKDCLVLELADYFEKEDTNQAEIGHNFNFDRKQFLKWAGVDEE